MDTDAARLTGPPALAAGTPAQWLASYLGALHQHDDDHHGDEPASVEPGWTGLGDLLADGAADLAVVHRLLVDDGTPPKAAATYLAGWVGGMVAEAVGFALAAAGAGFVVDADEIRLHRHPLGRFDAVDLRGPSVLLVTDGHPWAGQDGVEVVAADEVLARTVGALVEACRPVGEPRPGR
ncbi:MAG: hypothetical protein ACRD29_26455 [Acidimicrobiales bacterium]